MCECVWVFFFFFNGCMTLESSTCILLLHTARTIQKAIFGGLRTTQAQSDQRLFYLLFGKIS